MALYYARDVLFEPLGIEDVRWSVDKQAINIGGTMMYTTPRDMAKLGYLYLNNGTWDGDQIVPKEWVINATTPYIQSFDRNYDYGYYWWLDSDGEFYSAWGSEGQRIFVFPQYDLVVVFTASDDSYEPYEYLLENYILPANSDYTPKVSVNSISIISVSMIVISLAKRKLRKRN